MPLRDFLMQEVELGFNVQSIPVCHCEEHGGN